MAKPRHDSPLRAVPSAPRTFDIICEQIRAQLVSGALKAGDKLPAERELAGQLGVSRNALREALRSLEAVGIVRNAKGAKGGAFIQAAEPDRIIQAMKDYVDLGDISLSELTEARVALQDVIIRLVCARGEDSDFDELEAIASRTRQESDVEARYLSAVEFYAVMARATKNRIFGIFVQSLAVILHEFVKGPDYETLQKSLIDSRFRLVRLMRMRDAAGATEEMRKHLGRVHRHIKKNNRRLL